MFAKLFNRPTTRTDIVTAFIGAALAAYKAYDTTAKYKAEQASLKNQEINK